METSEEQALSLSQTTLRRIIGWLGLLLPLLLVALTRALQTSVSDYYYSNARDFFEGVLFFLGVFLIAYRPYGEQGKHDFWITTTAGIFGLLLALFPTYNATQNHTPHELVLWFIPDSWSGNLHNVGSAGLFLCFAVLSTFYFTKGKNGAMSQRKLIRNAIYMAAGIGIAVCIGIIGWGAATAPNQAARDMMNIFWPEATALVLFGFSWLVKGETFKFLND